VILFHDNNLETNIMIFKHSYTNLLQSLVAMIIDNYIVMFFGIETCDSYYLLV